MKSLAISLEGGVIRASFFCPFSYDTCCYACIALLGRSDIMRLCDISDLSVRQVTSLFVREGLEALPKM